MRPSSSPAGTPQTALGGRHRVFPRGGPQTRPGYSAFTPTEATAPKRDHSCGCTGTGQDAADRSGQAWQTPAEGARPQTTPRSACFLPRPRAPDNEEAAHGTGWGGGRRTGVYGVGSAHGHLQGSALAEKGPAELRPHEDPSGGDGGGGPRAGLAQATRTG